MRPATVDFVAEGLTRLPGFYEADAEMRRRSEPILREIEVLPVPRRQAITWFDAHAECYATLVTDHRSWEIYRILLSDLWYPLAYEYLFGSLGMQPLLPEGIALANELDAHRRHWLRNASVILASDHKPDIETNTDLADMKQAKRGKPVRRNARYARIDRALGEISGAWPKNHEEVFRFLDDRRVPIPNRKPFKPAASWMKGFQQNQHAASAWLSQAWGRLGLPSFPRGPKK